MEKDLLLIQNVSVAGTEFSEKYVNIAKGGLLSADTNGVPTVLAGGTNTYMLVRDDGETTGLKWVAVSGGHTQNTDTGTTSNTFTVDSDSTTGKITIDVALNAGEDHTMTLTNAAMAGDVTITFPATTGTVALASQLHTQGTDAGTTGSTFDIDSDGTTNGVRIKATSGALILRNLADDAYADLTVKDLTVQGTTTTINSTTITVDDKNIELGSVASPTDITADGGGITLKGATDKTILWDNANDNWSFNQAVNVESGLTYKIANTTVLSATQVLGVTLGTMAAETATNYVPKSLYDANTVLYATADNTPLALTVGASTVVGRKSSGDIVALTPAELANVLCVTAPATKTSAGTAGQIAFDTNFMYRCVSTNVWTRSAMATNW